MYPFVKSGRMRWLFGVIFLSVKYFFVDGDICNTKDLKDHVTVAALIGIHEDSSNCSEVSLRGIQELATLEKIVSYINVNDAMKEGIKIDLKVLDTCSNVEGATKAILSALIVSQQTCLYPPLFLGLIGPEDHKLLESVQLITATFDKLHLIPFTPEITDDLKQTTVFSVGTSRMRPRCKIILSVLNHLEWKSLIVVRDEIEPSMWLTDYMQTFTKDYLCILNVLKIPKYRHNVKTFFQSVINEFRTLKADGILIITEDVKNIILLSQMMKEFPVSSDIRMEISIIVYISKIGLRPWNVPHNVIILQEISNNKKIEDLEQFYNMTLFDEYQKQLVADYRMVNCASAKYGGTKWEEECLSSNVNIPSTAFSELIDSNSVPLEYGFRIFWSALKSAHRAKCKFDSFGGVERGVCDNLLKISPTEWKTFLQKSTFTKHDVPKRIGFQFNIPAHVNIYVNYVSSGLTLLGYLSDNDTIKFDPSVISIPVFRKPSSTQHGCPQVVTNSIITTSFNDPQPPSVTKITATTTTVKPSGNRDSDGLSIFKTYWERILNTDYSKFSNMENWVEHIPEILCCILIFFILFICSMKCLFACFKSN